jgi:hypothetical protein
VLDCSKDLGNKRIPGLCVESMWEHRNVFIDGREARGLGRGE